MFQSATLKLTAWYLAIIMAISLVFSVVIYQINFHEVNVRLENLEEAIKSRFDTQTPQTFIDETGLRQIQSDQAALQMLLSLLYINIFILVAGGAGSYFLARRTLHPIEEAHEAQSRFTSDASHELRTPLAAIKAEIEVALRDKVIDPIEARELLESNLEEVEKLIQLSEMLLSLSRLDYNTLTKEKLDLPEVLKIALKPHKSLIKRFDITMRKGAFVEGDKAAITELITILIDNALKYSPDRSKISIRIFQRLRTIGFEISNSGPQIDEKALPHIFDRFYRGDVSRTNSTKNGYGLGLAIAKRIIDVHEGDIFVQSSKEKTTFTFHLPVFKQNKA